MGFARFVSVGFLLVQALLMLCVAYSINELLVGNYEKEGANGVGCSGVIIIVITALITIGNVTWMVFQFIWFSGCATNNVIMSVTVVAAIASYTIVFFRTR